MLRWWRILRQCATRRCKSLTINNAMRTLPSNQSHGIEIGDIVEFGAYDWRVLDLDGNYALILTENIITRRDDLGGLTWESSSVRRYLNGHFYNEFLSEERVRIREVRLTNNNNQWFNRYAGINTVDKIFLLSIEEVVMYFGDSLLLQNKPSLDASHISDAFNNMRIAQHADTGENVAWRLRSPGDGRFFSAVSQDGSINMAGYFSALDIGVRPALWLNLEN